MTTFADSAAAVIDARPGGGRLEAWRAFEEVGLPSSNDEIWRYTPLTELGLEHHVVPTGPSPVAPSDSARRLADGADLVLTVVDGYLAPLGELPKGVHVSSDESGRSHTGRPLAERYARDAFSLLNAALAPATTVVRVEAGTVLSAPVVVLGLAGVGASFPRLRVEVGRGAEAVLVEYLEGGRDGLVVPLSEYAVDADGSLTVVTYQRLDETAWQVARTTGVLERDARLHQAVIGLGGHYDRSRNDAELRGAGATNVLRTTFLGRGDQVHDFRTRQLHLAPRTTSRLLSKGAVAERSRSVYTGLIEIEKGATRTDARQTNHNLLLSSSAHADSVPNLDIRENDVLCAHASSVGPLDALQRWYLESRGVERVDALRLMIQGFFYEMLEALPASLAAPIEADVAAAVGEVARAAVVGS
ncbi:MAG: hypothetical protein B7Z69_05145 [Actinobacteria bacterium 21-73-9]|nr:MAG: hypothetical protein B7Z69_05145 [Actinobacteria bacterium 21-73-9]